MDDQNDAHPPRADEAAASTSSIVRASTPAGTSCLALVGGVTAEGGEERTA
ncbi:hypothetical protein [Sorangium sp. So ce1182]|uniref:hypothetical protein n=1 Tax=Sorangium sp. So ce1182 TaxID=3133334 RepID=UPI003F611FC3